jgi:hypothetical protein
LSIIQQNGGRTAMSDFRVNMQTITLNKNSWHYRLATKYQDNKYPSENFCEYFWAVVKGFFAAVLIYVVISILIGGVLDFLIWSFVCLNYGYITPNPFSLVIVFALSWLGIIFLAAYFKDKKQERLRLSEVPVKISFFTLAYGKFKEKTCVKIEFE